MFCFPDHSTICSAHTHWIHTHTHSYEIHVSILVECFDDLTLISSAAQKTLFSMKIFVGLCFVRTRNWAFIGICTFCYRKILLSSPMKLTFMLSTSQMGRRYFCTLLRNIRIIRRIYFLLLWWKVFFSLLIFFSVFISFYIHFTLHVRK